MITLDTARLAIRNFYPDDWQDLQSLAIAYQGSEAAKYEDPWPTSETEVKGMASWFASGDDYIAACLKEAGTVIGLIHIGRREGGQGRVHNLGYVFHPGYQGQGYATEGCRAAMAYVFDVLAADSILTGTHPDNQTSIALLNRLGLQAIGQGEYAISRQEWLALGRGSA
jgi:ribosomal-protein-alanine N-acetyltransferase